MMTIIGLVQMNVAAATQDPEAAASATKCSMRSGSLLSSSNS